MSSTTDKAGLMMSDWHRVGAGLAVRFSLQAGRFDAEWLPRPPTKREWTRVTEHYHAARHQFLAVVSARVGGTVVCVEVAP